LIETDGGWMGKNSWRDDNTKMVLAAYYVTHRYMKIDLRHEQEQKKKAMEYVILPLDSRRNRMNSKK